MARRSRVLLASACLLALCGCPSGLDLPSDGSADLPQNENQGQGFEPGVAPTDPIDDDASIAGGIIPGLTPQQDLVVAFFVFTTATDAANADGSGTPLVRETPPPVDGNGASDVFAAAVIRSSNPGSTTPNTFTQAIAPVMRHPRCVTCHSFHYPGGFGSGGQHTGGNSIGTNTGCLGCHDSDIGLSETGGAIDWRAPTVAQGDFDFRNKTTAQLYQMVMTNSVPGVVAHLKHDDRIFWAIESGLAPQPPGTNLGDVPISKAQWDALVQAWAQGGLPPQFGGTGTGFKFDTSGAVLDLTLVSKKKDASFNEAGDAASQHPHAVYVPDPAYDPSSSAPQTAGRLHVVFASDATDFLQFVGAPSVARDVWHAVVEVRMNEEPQAGLADPGKLNLRVRQDLLERMSRSIGGAPGNLASDEPVIAGDASVVAFESAATNLVPAFVDANGAGLPDVFAAQPGTNNTTLVSHAFGFAARGGGGLSRNPSISNFAEAVAFETEAEDLFAALPSNFVRNIALAKPPGAVPALVSVRSSGVPGTIGACRNPAVFVDGGGAALVVFESDKHDLVNQPAVITGTQIYLRSGNSTVLVTQNGGQCGDKSSTRPSLSADGGTVLFQSSAKNLDTVRPLDANGVSDVLRFDVRRFLNAGVTEIERISLAPDGSDADGASTAPVLGTITRTPLSFDGGMLAFYRTQASNTGKAVNTDAMLVFMAP